MTRREFVPLAASMAASLAYSAKVPGVLRVRDWELAFGPSGDIASFRQGGIELINTRLPRCPLQITYLGKAINLCDRPNRVYQTEHATVFEFHFDDPYALTVRLETRLQPFAVSGVVLTQRVVLTSSTWIRHEMLVQLPRVMQVPGASRNVFLPMKTGLGKTKEIRGLDNEDDYVYKLSGSCGSGSPQLLALPMVHESSTASDLRLTHCTDPLFTSLIRLPFKDQIGQVQWMYPVNPGLPPGGESRTIVTVVHTGDEAAAIQAFYETVLADVKPGPDWLHEIALVDYDYLSKNGRGWFSDIDRLTELVAVSDRHKVLLALHGWYDLIGNYTFEPKTASLKKSWTAFPNARSPKVQSLGLPTEKSCLPTLLGTPGYTWLRKSVEALQPVPLSIDDVHRRIRYAKSRGFRVALYFADGLNASDSLKDIYSPDKVLRWGGWEGPDTAGKVYAQNPIHPEVRAFYIGYVKALLHEYGKELDGFVWDETFTVPTGEIGSAVMPGYADRALMTLMREVAAEVTSYPDLAFLSSDNIGYADQVRNAPYALMAHGTYQDSHCHPEAWSYALFPNYRNTFWSCNWGAVSNFQFMKFGVDHFDTPVAISNGAFGDDIGISEMDNRQTQRIMEVFERRKRKQMKPSWVTESSTKGSFEYGGNTFPNRYNLPF